MFIKILLVEDSPTQAMQTKMALETQHLSVVHAANGVEALELARAEPPDAIMSDILMPGMDGFTLLREVREDPLLSRIPVILHTTTFHAEEDRAFALKLGADAFSEKGMSPERLASLVREVVEKESAPNTIDEEDFSGRRSDRLLDRLLQAKTDLEGANEALSAALLSLSQEIQRIEDINGTISDVADRAILLALNTSEDVAQGNEEGDRSAIVAHVRRLAGQSKEAAVRVRGMLANVSKEINYMAPSAEHASAVEVTGDEDAVHLIRELATAVREKSNDVQPVTDKNKV